MTKMAQVLLVESQMFVSSLIPYTLRILRFILSKMCDDIIYGVSIVNTLLYYKIL